MDKELRNLIDDFYNKFNAAYNARREIEDYLEEHYDIDVYENADAIEKECDWCYGVDVEAIEKLIEESKENKYDI